MLDEDRRHRRADAADEGDRRIVDVGDHRLGVLVEALAQARCRWHLGQAERRLEELIRAPALDGVEIALAGAQQPDVALHAIGVRDPVPQRDPIEALGQARLAERASDQRQTRVRGDGVRAGLHDLEAAHPFTRRVSRPRQAR
jgi:hypothetical protein